MSGVPIGPPDPTRSRATDRQRVGGASRRGVVRSRGFQVALATGLILGAIATAVVEESTPTYRSDVLAESGNFFALAESGETLFAASGNGGSILLEQSSDHGLDWSQNPVPYSAVAGGSPWDLAAIAVDGPNLLLTAATGGVTSPPYPGGDQPGGFGAPISPGPCGTNSTILIALSPDDGISWNTSTYTLGWAAATSLQTEINGDLEAVAWTAETLGCDNSSGEVGALTSMDGGGSWSAIQSLSPIGATVPRGEQIEMAPQRQGLVVAFGTIPDDQSTAQLRLWDLSAGDEYGFTPGAVIPAPSSWTLQGSATSGAFLLTPTYLIPLGTPPYTALPFRQLQVDGGGIGLLPSVVSLVPIDTSTVEIAATNADNRGVDCWQVDVVHFAVVQTCHIRLVASLTSSASDLPIVALIDDGNGWVAIGASGAGTPGCDPQCSTAPVAGTASSSASAAGTPVGTSVCFGGCSSAEGLAAYTYAPGSSHWQALVDEAAAGVVALSGVWLLANLVAYRRSYPRPFPATSDATVVPGEEEVRRRRAATLSHRYRVGLGIWALAWAPLLLLAFFPAYGGDPAILTGAAVIGATLGALTSSFYIGEVRRRLQVSSGATIERLLGGDDARAEEVPFQMTRQLALFAYGSWTAVLVFLSLFFVTVTGGFGSEGFGSTGDPAAGPATVSAGDVLVLASLLVAVGLRALYHYQLAVATSLTQARAPPNPGTRDWAGVRSSLGAALLVWNPLVGLIVGTVLSGMLPDGPQVLAEAAVPVTLLGIALLAGAFGPTRWAPPRWVEGPGGSLAGDGPATGFATAGPPRS